MLNIFEKYGLRGTVESADELIPAFKTGKDLFVFSEKPEIKTISFTLPLKEFTEKKQRPYGIILAETAELCSKITEEMNFYCKDKNLLTVFYSKGITDDKGLKKANFIILTPSELNLLKTIKAIDLEKVRFIIIHNYNRIINNGLIGDTESFVNSFKEKKQIVLLLTGDINSSDSLIERILNDPLIIHLKPKEKKDFLKQTYYYVSEDDKPELLIRLLKNGKNDSAVFCNKKKTVSEIGKKLKKWEINFSFVNNEKKENPDSNQDVDTKGKKLTVLLLNDEDYSNVDLKNITHVYNYELPSKSDNYFDRIKRTSAYGKAGETVSFITGSGEENFLKKSAFKIKGRILIKTEEDVTEILKHPIILNEDKKPVQEISNANLKISKEEKENIHLDIKKEDTPKELATEEENKKKFAPYKKKKKKNFKGKQEIQNSNKNLPSNKQLKKKNKFYKKNPSYKNYIDGNQKQFGKKNIYSREVHEIDKVYKGPVNQEERKKKLEKIDADFLRNLLKDK